MASETHEAPNQGTKPLRAILWLGGLLILVLLGLGVWWLQKEKSPILVGVSITLTGPEASIGQSVLNGIRMAVDEQNTAGGVRGRQVELLVRDDEGDPDLGIRNDRELLEAGVVAIWGHMASRVTEPAVNAMAQVDPDLLYINSISTARSLTGRDDGLIRLIPDSAVAAENYVRHYLPQSTDKRAAVIYEATFPAISDTLRPAFVDNWQNLGGVITAEVGMASETSYDAQQIASQALSDRPSSVFIGLPPLPAAVICQHLRTQQPEVELLVYSWALTAQDFLSSGGSAIEGAAGLSRMPIVPDTPAHISYAQNYEERYKSRPTRADAMAYEAMQILLWAMQQTDDRKQYKSLILEKGTFDGLVGPLVLDAFGDIQRSYYITRVQNGQLVTEGEVRGANESQ